MTADEPPAPPTRYTAGLLDHSIPLELQRLRALETFADPAVHQILDGTGPAPGWCCLEVAAGAGSIARWLVARAAPAEVVATDLDTSVLPTYITNLAVLRHDGVIQRSKLFLPARGNRCFVWYVKFKAVGAFAGDGTVDVSSLPTCDRVDVFYVNPIRKLCLMAVSFYLPETIRPLYLRLMMQ
jgi:hypothetical protein